MIPLPTVAGSDNRGRMMRSIILGFLLAFSIVLNIGTLAVTSVATVVSGLFESVTGIGSVLGAAGEGLSLVQARLAKTEGDLKTKEADLKTAKAKNVDLTGKLETAKARNTKLTADLKVTTDKNVKLLQEVADLKAERIVTYRGNKHLLKYAVSDTSRRVSSRTATGASRNLAATFGEAWPVAGTAVIVTATTLELYDACVIMRDLHELDLAFNPEAASDAGEKEVCGMKVPTAEEIWAKIRNSPGEVWRMVTEALPDLPEMPKDYILSLPWGDYEFKYPWE